MAPARPSSFLDRPAARVVALGVFGLCVAALVYIHRDDIRPGPAEEAETAAADDPAARCLAERYAQIDGMVGEGVIGPEQERLFRSRAAAFCEAQQGGAAGPGLASPGDDAAVRPPGSPAAAGGPGLPPPEALKPQFPAGGATPPPPGAVRPPGG